jgi:hypothetical protein
MCAKTKGLAFVINNEAGNQPGVVTGFNAGKYLVTVNTGFSRGSSRVFLAMDIYGVFVTTVMMFCRGMPCPCIYRIT